MVGVVGEDQRLLAQALELLDDGVAVAGRVLARADDGGSVIGSPLPLLLARGDAISPCTIGAACW